MAALLFSIRAVSPARAFRSVCTTLKAISNPIHPRKKVHRRNPLQSVNSVVTSKHGSKCSPNAIRSIAAALRPRPARPPGPEPRRRACPVGPEPRRRAWPAHPGPSRWACPERSLGERSEREVQITIPARRLQPASPISGGLPAVAGPAGATKGRTMGPRKCPACPPALCRACLAVRWREPASPIFGGPAPSGASGRRSQRQRKQTCYGPF
jgi:hypothetical protein